MQTAQPVDKILNGDSTLLKTCVGLQAQAPLRSEYKTTQRSKDKELFVVSLSKFMVSWEETGKKKKKKNSAEQVLCPCGSADLCRLPLLSPRMCAMALGVF